MWEHFSLRFSVPASCQPRAHDQYHEENKYFADVACRVVVVVVVIVIATTCNTWCKKYYVLTVLSVTVTFCCDDIKRQSKAILFFCFFPLFRPVLAPSQWVALKIAEDEQKEAVLAMMITGYGTEGSFLVGLSGIVVTCVGKKRVLLLISKQAA